ncbi:hypothetical protein FRB91_008936 [Serendipita sp. 411]|nr:hypothetical protein FRC18_004595 [Serendipita sp. 400]KAG8850602.1 hypothetical protein FRB91_008936 [Serendipita sp. 411]
MHSTMLVQFLYLFLLGSSTVVVAVPAPVTKSTRGSPNPPGSPRSGVPMPSKDFPPVMPGLLKEACKEAEETVLAKCMRREQARHNPGLPGEDGLSDDVIDKLLKFGIEEIVRILVGRRKSVNVSYNLPLVLTYLPLS